MGVGATFSRKKRYEGIRFNVIKGWVGVQFPEKALRNGWMVPYGYRAYSLTHADCSLGRRLGPGAHNNNDNKLKPFANSNRDTSGSGIAIDDFHSLGM